MGQIKKVGDEYFIEFYARGLLYQKNAGPSLKEAEDLLRQTESTISKGEIGTEVCDVDWIRFQALFLDEAERKYSPKTFHRFKAAINHFHSFFNEQESCQKLSQVTPRVMVSYQKFLLDSSVKPRLTRFTLEIMREVLEFGIKLGYINDNPLQHVKLIKVKSNPVTTYGRVGILRLCELMGCDDVLKVFRYHLMR